MLGPVALRIPQLNADERLAPFEDELLTGADIAFQVRLGAGVTIRAPLDPAHAPAARVVAIDIAAQRILDQDVGFVVGQRADQLAEPDIGELTVVQALPLRRADRIAYQIDHLGPVAIGLLRLARERIVVRQLLGRDEQPVVLDELQRQELRALVGSDQEGLRGQVRGVPDRDGPLAAVGRDDGGHVSSVRGQGHGGHGGFARPGAGGRRRGGLGHGWCDRRGDCEHGHGRSGEQHVAKDHWNDSLSREAVWPAPDYVFRIYKQAFRPTRSPQRLRSWPKGAPTVADALRFCWKSLNRAAKRLDLGRKLLRSP